MRDNGRHHFMTGRSSEHRGDRPSAQDVDRRPRAARRDGEGRQGLHGSRHRRARPGVSHPPRRAPEPGGFASDRPAADRAAAGARTGCGSAFDVMEVRLRGPYDEQREARRSRQTPTRLVLGGAWRAIVPSGDRRRRETARDGARLAPGRGVPARGYSPSSAEQSQGISRHPARFRPIVDPCAPTHSCLHIAVGYGAGF